MIHIDKDDYASMIDYFVSLSQEEYDPEDPDNPCTNYPTEEFSSYADCDDHFVTRSLPPGLKPFWAVDNLSEASSVFSIKTEEYNGAVTEDLFYGTSGSDCLQPCVTTRAEVQKIIKTVNKDSIVALG